MQTDCAQIFFPTDILNKTGYIIGFNTRGFSFTIMWIDEIHSIEEIEEQLQQWKLQENIQHICGTCLQVLGIVSNDKPSQFRDTWLHMSFQNQLVLEELMICGYKYNTKSTIVLYDRIMRNQTVTFQNETREYLKGEQKKFYDLNPQIIFHKTLEQLQKEIPNQELHELEYTLIHINLRSSIINEFQNKKQEKRSYYETFLQRKSNDWFFRIVLNVCLFQQMIFKYFLYIMQYQVKGKSLQDTQILKNTFKQVNLKYLQIQQWNELARQLLDQENQQYFRTEIVFKYHKLFSGMLYNIMDTLFGLFSLFILYYNVTWLREFIHKYGSSIHIEVLSKEIEWLMGFPAGLKTNKPLNSVLGQMILYIFFFWNEITTFVTPYETYLLRMMLIFGLFGITFEIALAIDVISLCTMHVYYIYRILTFTYEQIWHVLSQYKKITKDKFQNVLTQKTEDRYFSWERKLLAMFMGFFLLMMIPTVSLYYFWFLLIVIFIYISKIILLCVQKIFSRFPLFLIYAHFYMHTIPSYINLTVDDKSRIVKLHYQKVPLTSIVHIEKLFKLNNNIKFGQVINAVLLGKNLMTKTNNQKYQIEIKSTKLDNLYKL